MPMVLRTATRCASVGKTAGKMYVVLSKKVKCTSKKIRVKQYV
jgi:hypothetical protein